MLRSFAEGSLLGERFGEDPPWVLALHGWARTHEDFRDVLASQQSPRRETDPFDGKAIDAIAIDLPGFGSATPPSHGFGSSEYAEFIAPILSEMADHVVVLGHSFGGRVALHLAVKHPEQVRALVLTGVPLRRTTSRKVRIAPPYRGLRFLARHGLVGEQVIERARQRYGSEDYKNASGVMRQVLVTIVQEDYEPVLERLDLPLDLIWGEHDTVVPLEVARMIADEKPSARFEALRGIDHFVPLRAPQALRAGLARERP